MEKAGDIALTIILLGLGLDEFSVSPIAVPEIKKVVRSISYTEAQEIAQKALEFKTGKEVQEFARAKLKKIVPDMEIELS